MKKVILVCVMFMMFMGVVSASSINGEYKGSPIVRVTSNGVNVSSTDVPAVILDGRTLVPIRVLTKLGATVKWNGDEYSVDIKLPEADNSKLYLTREYAALFDYYVSLQRLGDRFHIIQANLVIDVAYIAQNINIEGNLKDASDNLNYGINEYNRLQGFENNIISNAANYNITENNIDSILKNFSKSLDSFKLAVEKINSYKTNKNYISDFNDTLHDANASYTLSETAAFEGYSKYYNLTQTGISSPVYTPSPTPVVTPSPTPSPIYTPAPTPGGKAIDYMMLYSNDGKTYLGKLTSNIYDTDSIFNDYGDYGGKYSEKSIFNDYGTYGGKYSSESPFNQYTSTPPMILLDGKVVGHLTINTTVSDAVSPLGLKEYLMKLGY